MLRLVVLAMSQYTLLNQTTLENVWQPFQVVETNLVCNVNLYVIDICIHARTLSL
jgi:hypothetical protein